MSFELVGGVGLGKAFQVVGALGAAGINLVNKLKRTGDYQLSLLTGRASAAGYARANSFADWWRAPEQLTDLVQMYAMLNRSERAALAGYVGGETPAVVRYSGPAITLSRRREYDELGRLRVEEDSVTVRGSEIEMLFSSSESRPRKQGRRGWLPNPAGAYSYGRASDAEWWTT